MKGLVLAHPFVRWMLPAVALSAIVAAPLRRWAER
jgi:hypothetical protein